MKIEAETFMDYLDSALAGTDSKALADLIAGSAELQREERAYRRLQAAERLAQSESDSLPPTFEHAVMRRVRVAVPPGEPSLVQQMGSACAELLSSLVSHPRILASSCLSILAIALIPVFVLQSGVQPSDAPLSRDLYDPAREQPYMRLVNAVTARIPEGYRAISFGAAGRTIPGDKVDVVWLYHQNKRSTATLIARDVQVLSTERRSEEESDSPAYSTVTLLLAAEDAGKVELAASTGQLALSVRDSSDAGQNSKPQSPVSVVTSSKAQPELDFLGPDGQVERYLVRDGRLIPRI